MNKTDLGKTNKKNASTHAHVRCAKKRRKNKSAHERLADWLNEREREKEMEREFCECSKQWPWHKNAGFTRLSITEHLEHLWISCSDEEAALRCWTQSVYKHFLNLAKVSPLLYILSPSTPRPPFPKKNNNKQTKPQTNNIINLECLMLNVE